MTDDRLSSVVAKPVERIAVCIDGELVRRGLTAMIESANEAYHVVHWKHLDSVEKISRPALDPVQPDVLILACDGENTKAVQQHAERATTTGIKVLLLLMHDHELFDTVAGIPANGFLMLQEITPSSLERALHQVACGETFIPAMLATRLLTRVRDGAVSPRPGPDSLTPREQQTLKLLVDGLSNKQIAKELHISQHGAKRLVASVLAKLNCHNRTLAVAVALRDQILN